MQAMNRVQPAVSKNLTTMELGPDREIVIGDDVFIGAGTVILAGRTIGTGSIVGAGSVVTRDVEPWTIVAGNPAQLVRHRERLSAPVVDPVGDLEPPAFASDVDVLGVLQGRSAGGDGVTDDTAAIQRTIDAAIGGSR